MNITIGRSHDKYISFIKWETWVVTHVNEMNSGAPRDTTSSWRGNSATDENFHNGDHARALRRPSHAKVRDEEGLFKCLWSAYTSCFLRRKNHIYVNNVLRFYVNNFIPILKFVTVKLFISFYGAHTRLDFRDENFIFIRIKSCYSKIF
jgi:hypothetical protein